MREFGFRHLPICQDHQLMGLISLRDLLVVSDLQQRASA